MEESERQDSQSERWKKEGGRERKRHGPMPAWWNRVSQDKEPTWKQKRKREKNASEIKVSFLRLRCYAATHNLTPYDLQRILSEKAKELSSRVAWLVDETEQFCCS